MHVGARRRGGVTVTGSDANEEVRPFGELRDSGLLWLINATVFHPRGWALALTMRNGEATGWKLLGDGKEPWYFYPDGTDELFAKATATLRAVETEE